MCEVLAAVDPLVKKVHDFWALALVIIIQKKLVFELILIKNYYIIIIIFISISG